MILVTGQYISKTVIFAYYYYLSSHLTLLNFTSHDINDNQSDLFTRQLNSITLIIGVTRSDSILFYISSTTSTESHHLNYLIVIVGLHVDVDSSIVVEQHNETVASDQAEQ